MPDEVLESCTAPPANMMRAGLSASVRSTTRVERPLPSTLPSMVLSSTSPRSRSPPLGHQASRAASAADGLGAGGGPVSPSRKLFSFGIATDVQYANLDQGFSHGGQPRFYRDALQGLRRAVGAWREGHVGFAMHLGDIIDGKARTHSEAAMEDVLREFAVLERRVYHLIGNHCLYNFPRAELNERLGIPGEGGNSYYAFSPHPAWRFVVLDAFDVSVLGWPPGHPKHEAAHAILEEHNPNEEKNSPDGMAGPARRFVMFGGGLSEGQLEWLEAELRAAKQAGQRCLVFSHLPMHPETCTGTTLMWNYKEAMRLIQGAGNVAAFFAGHTHKNGAATDEFGIHYLALAAILETPPGSDCFGTVTVYEDRLELSGVGEMQSGVLQFPEAHQLFERQLGAEESADMEQQAVDRNALAEPLRVL